MSKIIFINRYFYPDHSATSQLLSDLAFDLAAHSVGVCVITSRQVYDNPSAELLDKETVQGVGVIRIWTSRYGRRHLWGRALDYLTFYFSAAWHLTTTVERGDTVVAKTDPPLISVVAAIVAKLRGATLVNWVQDMFPEVAFALNVKVISVVGPLLRALRNFSLHIARVNVVLGERMAKRVVAQGVSQAKVKVVHNWSDGSDIEPIAAEQNSLRREWGLQDKFVVGYSGNMGRAHEFETLVNAAALLKQDRRIVFLFIGGGAKREWVEQEVKRLGLDNVAFKPYQPRDMLTHSLGVPDVHVISLQPELEGLIVPSKFYGIAAAGRPTLYIGDDEGEIAGIIKEEECGCVARIGDARCVVSCLHALLDNREMLLRFGSNARNAFEQRFDKRLALDAWQQVLGDDAKTSTPEKKDTRGGVL